MDKAFVYGMSVEGENFTDRIKETARLKKDFENGLNVILMSPRRMGKTSLVKKVKSEIKDPKLKVVLMDVYDCRSEYDFYNRFASSILKQTASKTEQVLENIKKFLVRVSPKISFSTEPLTDFSLSLGITPKEYSPEEILQLPEVLAKEKNIHLIVCIDEFQQIGEFPDSITVQKRMRGVWQHQQNVSYCLFGSKKHLMTKLFQSRRMPFFQFGEVNELKPIPTKDWVTFIQQRFKDKGQSISAALAQKICETVEGYSSYVQQLAWNVMAETDKEATETSLNNGIEALLAQNASFFTEQTRGLSTYQLNFIRAICKGYHSGFTSKTIAEQFPMGTKSNIPRIKASLLDREIIDEDNSGVVLADCVFQRWFMREFM
ncbi:MAG: ATP-binding protein [Prevotella sp.]|jgi:AAA+ ATPase superfamily predicted ATPase|nr:ATP-binding protein [Prevotella sp.]